MEQKKGNWTYSYEQQILQLCFDSSTLKKMSLGLKLVFAQDDPPIFVNIKSINLGSPSLGNARNQ